MSIDFLNKIFSDAANDAAISYNDNGHFYVRTFDQKTFQENCRGFD